MNLKNLTITESLMLLREKKISSSELVRDQIDHIEKLDPKIDSYLYVDKEGAFKEAEERDRQGFS